MSFSEDLISVISKAIKVAYRKYYYDYDMFDDLYQESFLYILTKSSEFKNLDGENLFYKVYSLSKYAMNSFIRKDKTLYYSDIPNSNADENNCSFTPVSNSTPEDYLKSRELYCNYLNFLKTYNLKISKIFNLYFNNVSIKQIAKYFNLTPSVVGHYILKFRVDFKKYLENIYNFKLPITIGLTIKDNIATVKNRVARYKLKASGGDYYSMYPNDYLILKLLRSESNLTNFANCLIISLEELNSIIYHKKINRKLTLYQIQKLRKNFFPNYTLYDLVEV